MAVRNDPLQTPGRGAVGKILDAADQTHREHQAIEGIRTIFASESRYTPDDLARKVRTILRDQGLL